MHALGAAVHVTEGEGTLSRGACQLDFEAPTHTESSLGFGCRTGVSALG